MFFITNNFILIHFVVLFTTITGLFSNKEGVNHVFIYQMPDFKNHWYLRVDYT